MTTAETPTAAPSPMPLLYDGEEGASTTVVLAHGAGAAMDSPAMNVIAAGLAAHAMRVVRFEFPYMHRRRGGGGRGAPDPPRMLEATWLAVIAALGGGGRLVVGGRSMGGRIASQVADRAGVRGLVCFGYPFHPPGQPAKLRTAHLVELATPTLIVQGTRDEFGNAAEVAGYTLSAAIRLAWIDGGDHSFKRRQHVEQAIASAADFIAGLPPQES